MKFVKAFTFVFALLACNAVHAQLAAVPGDQRPADRDAIREHLDKIFQGFIHQDAAALRAGHSADWRGFLEGSRRIGRGIDQYMQAVSGALKSPVHMTAYKILDMDVMFYGDLAVVPYICEVEAGGPAQGQTRTYKEKLRILDVFAKLNGDWVQVATNTVTHPESLEEQLSSLANLDDEDKKNLLDARESVWRAYFANDRPKLDETIPPEVIAIDNGSEKWSHHDDILAGAKGFADSGGKLVRLEFPKTEIQVYANTAIIYSSYLYELEINGQRTTTTGRATEMFVFRDNKQWVNVGWHLDAEK